jgi:hypothetical protein
MYYRLRSTGAVLTQGEVRKEFPSISLPAVWDASVCDAIGVDTVETIPAPVVTPYQIVSENGVEQVDGKWVIKWEVRNCTPAEIENIKANEWDSVRTERNQRLSDSDWTQLPDAPLSNIKMAEWATYRQALRDITTQSDPFNIVWPGEPA